MADPILRSKITFGSSDRIEAAKQEEKINEFDILCLEDVDGDKMGWLDKNGSAHIIKSGMPESEVTAKIESSVEETKAYADEKVVAAIEESKTYADEKIETTVDTKVSEVVDEKVSEAIDSAVAEVKNTVSAIEYEISNKPEGTLVDVRDKEIRVMCPSGTVFEKQNSGAGSDANKYYIGFKAYAPNADIVSFKEDLAEIIADDTMYYFENNDFAGTDDNGRKYSVVWLPVATYDEASGTWSYFGANSSEEKYIGWYYSVEWYNANGKVVASDCIRINLSNEDCHSSIAPFYVNNTIAEANAYTDQKISEIAVGYEIVEF